MKKTILAAAAFAVGITTASFAQSTPAATAAGPAKVFLASPAGTTITNFYKQNIYDPNDNKIGDISDVLLDKEGQVTALMVAVGGFLGMGDKAVAVPFSPIRASEKNGKWYLVLDTTKDAL